MNTVNTDRVQLLVDELRSGRRRQAFGTLTELALVGTSAEDSRSEGHCCLGVGCVVAMANGLDLPHLDQDGYRVYADRSENKPELGTTNAGSLPWAAVAWYGFETQDPKIKIPVSLIRELDALRVPHIDELDVDWDGNATLTATYCNDELRLTFDQIADGFERMYLR